MVDQSSEVTLKLLALMRKTGCPIVQSNGQRRFGPPPNWSGPPPPKGCEIFIGKLPRDIFEDELVPIFSTAGTIYEMRLMMDFSGSNRGYAFLTYATRSEAAAAVKQLNNFEIRPRKNLGVVKSVDNCRLFIGNLPKTKTREDLMQELSKHVTDLVDVILYKNSFDCSLNRGFAFVEFKSHKAAAMARRELVPGCVKLWDHEVLVDWAEPEPDIDDEQMDKVKVLYVRNFSIWTTPEVIKKAFEDAINSKVERVKKIYDYAFIHFYKREHAELAMAKLQNFCIDDSCIEIHWSKPVDRDLYRIQKLHRGNAKFNKTYDMVQTLTLYKQHVNKMEYINSSPKDEGIGSGYAGNSPSISPMDFKPACASSPPAMLAPAKLESMCKRNGWMLPVYNYQKYIDATGLDLWICSVDLPQVGQPVLTTPRHVGPLTTGRLCYSMQQAYIEAAELALQAVKKLRVEFFEQQPPQPIYSQLSAVPNCMNFQYDYLQSMYSQPQTFFPAVWRTV